MQHPLDGLGLSPLHLAYDGNVCPDCEEIIPHSAVFGDSCSNCGHVFNEPRDDDDGQPDEAQEWHDFDPDC
jgi:Uncharacterised protein family UPF0547